jgi:hypothetical protein
VLGQETAFESDDVCRNPGSGPPVSRETAVRDDAIAFCDNELVFVAQGDWRGTNQIESPFATWCYVRAMLDVRRRPETFCGRIVALVEQSIEGFENDRLVLFGCCLRHVQLLGLSCDD